MTHITDLYAAALRTHLNSEPSPANDVSGQPPHSDQAIQDGTGRSWDQWVAAIDAGPGREATHTHIAAWVEANSDVGPWWAQGVTVGYERLTGRRLPGQMPDGTFSVSRSRTFATSEAAFRERFEGDPSRADLSPDIVAIRVSKPGVKAPRYALSDKAAGAELGALQLSVNATGAKTRLTVTHTRLPHFDAAEAWKSFWSAWLDQLK